MTTRGWELELQNKRATALPVTSRYSDFDRVQAIFIHSKFCRSSPFIVTRCVEFVKEQGFSDPEPRVIVGLQNELIHL